MQHGEDRCQANNNLLNFAYGGSVNGVNAKLAVIHSTIRAAPVD
jgi:hypothetical protein